MAIADQVRARVVSVIATGRAGYVTVRYSALGDGTPYQVEEPTATAPGLGEDRLLAVGMDGQVQGEPKPLPAPDAAFATWIARRVGLEDFEREPAAIQALVQEAFMAGRASR